MELIDLFNGSIEPKRIITVLELLLNMKISPSETLFIFDEAQEVPRVLTSLNVLTDSPEPRKYWSVLKTRLKKEGVELTTICSQLKMLASDSMFIST